MKSFFKVLILVTCCLLLLPMIVFAQDATLPQTIDLGGGYSISLPLAWTLLRGGGVITARGSDLTLKIFTPTYIDTLNTEINAHTNVIDALLTLYALPPTVVDIAKTDIQKARYDDRVAAVYTDLDDSTVDQMAVVLTMPSGLPGYLLFSADKGALDGLQDTIAPIIASFTGAGGSAADATPTPVHHGASIGGTSTTSNDNSATSGASDVNCTVSTDTANTAQLRVGPGTNRGAISFLPVNIEVTVTGRIVLNDKSVWYQLDKTEAAPKGTSAAELWIVADQVTTTGDCDHVGDTSAPPVIPGHIAPPPTATNNSGDQGASDQGSADSAPGAVPANGQWTMTFNATTNASCVGYENVPIPSEEVLEAMSYTYPLRVTNNSVFVYGDDTYTRVPGTNTFTGLFTWRDNTQSQAWLTVNSPTSINGQLIDNFTLDDTACSGTFLFLAAHH